MPELSENKAEIARLEALIEQWTTKAMERRTQAPQGLLSQMPPGQQGPPQQGPQPGPIPFEDTIGQWAANAMPPSPPPPPQQGPPIPPGLDQGPLPGQQGPPQGPLPDPSMVQPMAQGLLADDGAGMTPAQQEIASLEAQIAQAESDGQGGGPSMQMLQAVGGAGQNDIYGLLGYNAGGGQGGQGQFDPTMNIGNMQQIYAAMTKYGDDPAAIGENYVQSMQRNDQLRASNMESRFRVTDAMRPRPIGAGFEDENGYQVIPIWDPNMNNNRGGIRTQNVGRRLPETIEIAGVMYMKNPNQQDRRSPDYWIPMVDPTEAGKAGARLREELDLGGIRAISRGQQNELAQDMSLTDTRIRRLLNAENFSEVTGPMDNVIAWVGGAAAGGKDSLMNRELRMLHNELATIIVADWKGSISDKELVFFKTTIPSPSDHHDVWKTWYENKFLPAKQFAMEVARGMHDYTDMDLETYINNVSPGSQAIMDNDLVNKYAE